MSNLINPYLNTRVHPYQQVHRAQRTQPAQAPQPVQAAQQAPAAQRAQAPGLTTAEQQMIDRYFPDSPALQMKLYGPSASTRTVQPASLGARLDLTG